MLPLATGRQTAGMNRTLFDTPVITPILRMIANLCIRAVGWKKMGTLPDEPKCVVIAAPHTSNWDFPLMLCCVFAFRAKGAWMGKDSLFVGPLGPIMKWLGGIPIDRTKRGHAVEQAIAFLNESDRLIMIVSPEGTRSRVCKWKSGFYHIALGAKVPIVMGFGDYYRKVLGFGPAFMPTGNLQDDMKAIVEFYQHITPRHPDQFCLPDQPEPS